MSDIHSFPYLGNALLPDSVTVIIVRIEQSQPNISDPKKSGLKQKFKVSFMVRYFLLSSSNYAYFHMSADAGFIPATFRGKINTFTPTNTLVLLFLFLMRVFQTYKQYATDHIYAKSVNLFVEFNSFKISWNIFIVDIKDLMFHY